MPALRSTRSKLVALLSALALSLAFAGCRGKRAPDPGVEADAGAAFERPGAYIAAIEPGGRYRLYRMIAAEHLPPPLGLRIHLIIYDETAASLDDARELATKGGLTPTIKHHVMLASRFVPREHAVVGYAPLTAEERKTYDLDSRVH